MQDTVPKVTVVIAARPGQAEVKSAVASRSLDYPRDQLEILIARGRQPSVQRNRALREAQGDLIYFLDDDSVPQPGNLRRAIAAFRRPEVQMVGGPNLCPEDAPFLERVFAVVLGSWLAFGPSRAHYQKVGTPRATSEKELILCNLMARRKTMLELGGFNEALYPNEENALMDELQKRGGELIYDPDFVVRRRPRPTIRSFARMLLTYGRGRAEQFRLHPTAGSALNFVPPLFCLYLLIWPLAGLVGLVPLGCYAAAVLGQTAVSAGSAGPVLALAAMPFVVLSHLLYGLGFWRGLFTRLKPDPDRAPVEVTLERL